MKYEMQIVKRGIELMIVDLVLRQDDGTIVDSRKLDMSGNATSTVYYGAAKTVEAINQMLAAPKPALKMSELETLRDAVEEFKARVQELKAENDRLHRKVFPDTTGQ